MYAYLIGTVGLAIIFGALCFVRRDLRRVMIYSGLFYLFFMTVIFLLLKALSSDPAKAITPGYWSPPSMFDLNKKTGGYGIEDALYMFFVGAIAAGLYNVVFSFKISKKADKKLRKGHALAFALLVSGLLYTLTSINAVDFFISFQFIGGIAIVWQRRDLVLHALGGGVLFMFLYAALFAIFKLLFPAFLNNYYHLNGTSHVWILGIPLEEYLYAFTLGVLWAPIYEYEFKLKDSRSRLLGLRRVSLAAATTRR
jgi:hypothetical protein